KAAAEVVQDEKRAAACEHLQKCFERSYDLTKNGDRLTLVEALTEIGKATAMTGKSATLALSFGADGITGVTVTSVPSPAPADIKDK
ncbi:hypothetical protein ABTN36_18415, partial [Acinetobacter baumannii]